MQPMLVVTLVILFVAVTSKEPAKDLAPDESGSESSRLRCCVSGTMSISLHRSGYSVGNVRGIGKPTFNQQKNKPSCSTMARLKVNFQKPPIFMRNRCIKTPRCGRQMLQVELYLTSRRSDWLFNIGDSRTNNGWGGDAGTQSNDAEVQGKGNDFAAYVSDKCRKPKPQPPLSYVYRNAIGKGVYKVTLQIANEFVRVQNNKGLNKYICSDCMFGLGGQSDKEGSINYDVYVALNRVIAGTYRRGYGVCRAKLQWKCPFSSKK